MQTEARFFGRLKTNFIAKHVCARRSTFSIVRDRLFLVVLIVDRNLVHVLLELGTFHAHYLSHKVFTERMNDQCFFLTDGLSPGLLKVS